MNELQGFSGWRVASTDAPLATAEWITARVISLLSHYYQPELAIGLDELVMADWISALGDIPQQAIADAASEWIRDQDRRPTPSAIRRRALALLREPDRVQGEDPSGPFAPQVVSKEEVGRRRKNQAEYQRLFPKLRRI